MTTLAKPKTFFIILASLCLATILMGCGSSGGDSGSSNTESSTTSTATVLAPEDLSAFSNFNDGDSISISGNTSGTYSTSFDGITVAGGFTYVKTSDTTATLNLAFDSITSEGVSFTPNELAALAGEPSPTDVEYQLTFTTSTSGSYQAIGGFTDGSSVSDSGSFTFQ